MTPTPNLSASVQAKKGRLYAVIQVKKNGKMTGVWRSLELPEGSPKTKINKAFRDVVGRYEEECAEEIERNSRPISQLPIYYYMHIYLEKARGSLQLNTIRSYQNMIEGKIKAYVSDRPELTVSTLKAADINRFYEYLFSYDVSANTVIHYHVVLHRAFKQAFKDEQIDSNPFDRIDRPKKEKFEGDHYSKEELHALLEVARDDPIYPAIILAGCMGLRRSEAIGAKWSNIDWETRHILLDSKVVEVTIDDQHMVEVVSKMKNESSHRTIVIPNEMVVALLEIKERQELNKKMFNGSYNRKNDDFICTDQFGELLRPNYVTQHYRLLLEKNGLRHIRFHDLRHTFASILLSNRTELIEVSKFLGHSTIATTANIYAHLDMSNKEHTASVMSDILAGMNPTKAPK